VGGGKGKLTDSVNLGGKLGGQMPKRKSNSRYEGENLRRGKQFKKLKIKKKVKVLLS